MRGDGNAELLGPGYGELLWEPSRAFAERARISDYIRWLQDGRGISVSRTQTCAVVGG